jgi:ArsR family transcriptional regulator, arsenate/arsenite/antimonite-responsive transcriptional repressor
MMFYIDICRFKKQTLPVPSSAAIAKPSKPPAACCSPRTKLCAKDMSTYAALFKALGDETRLDILGFLAAAGGEVCACRIEEHIRSLTQPTISHHLRLLREAGLVTAERRGTWVYYTLDPSLRAQLAQFTAQLKA